MTFKEAVENTPAIAGAFCKGLDALKQSDRAHLKVKSPRRLSGSVNLDTALRDSRPEARRWDYGIGYSYKGEKVYWIEFHPASSYHVDKVLDKFEWLKQWLHTQAENLDRLPREFIWIASGKVSMQPGSPQRKKLAARGLFFAGGSFSINN